MEARIETGDLAHVREPLSDRVNCGKVVGLMQRREWNEAAKVFQDIGRHDRRCRVAHAAVHDTMPYADQVRGRVPRTEPGGDESERRVRVVHLPVHALLTDRAAGSVLDREPG